MEKTITICFFGTVNAGSELTLCSKRLNFPFTIQKLRCSFPLGTNHTVQISFFVSPDATTPTTGKPAGQNLLSPYSPTDYITGNDELKEITHNIEIPESGMYLKVYASNSDVFPHTVDAQVMIGLKEK